MRLQKIAFFTFAMILIASGALLTCPGYSAPTTALISTQCPELKGTWRAYSARLYFDTGRGSMISKFTQPLKLSAQGEWNFGTTSGKFTVENITGAD